MFSYNKKRKKDIEPLKRFPDYKDRNKHGSISKTAAINVNRVYFVNENYERLLVSAHDVEEGGEPTRFTGQLPYIPIPGGNEIISTDDFKRKFKVVRRHLIPNLSLNVPPKVYVVLQEID
jgi:hypothetical protein